MFETKSQGVVVPNPNHTEHAGEPLNKLATPANSAKSVKLAERKQKKQLFEKRQGMEDAQKWVDAAHPVEIIAFVKAVGNAYSRSRDPWAGLRFENQKLHDELESWGKDYSYAFISCVRTHWHVVRASWEHIMYVEGVADGRQWSLETTHPEFVDNLRSLVTSNPLEVLPNELSHSDEWDFISPAHKLVASVLGDDYPRSEPHEGDEIGDIIPDCDEFKEFWQPFVDEPMDQLVKVLEDTTFFTCKLQSSTYISGFVDGALGVSDSLKAKHLPD